MAAVDEVLDISEPFDGDSLTNVTPHQAASCSQTPTIEKSKMGDFIRKAIKSATEYNQQINQERKDERMVCMDLQTYTLHYPIGLGKENKQLIKNTQAGRAKTRKGRYPIATIPGQYQDWYVKYTSQELKYFPINTVLYGPVVTDPSKLPPLLTSAEEGSPSDSDDSDSALSDDAASCCSSKDGQEKPTISVETPSAQRTRRSKTPGAPSDSSSSSSSSESDTDGPPPLPVLMKEVGRGRPNAICKMCKGNRLQNKNRVPEDLVHCSDCENSSHPSCLELTNEMVDVIRSYPWQCNECKTCLQCEKSHEEDKMMFCDKCDRGYHTFCVGLKNIPDGKWVCKLCAQCAQCGVNTPVPGSEGKTAQWQHETIKIISPNGDTLRRHHLLCLNCYKQRRK